MDPCVLIACDKYTWRKINNNNKFKWSLIFYWITVTFFINKHILANKNKTEILLSLVNYNIDINIDFLISLKLSQDPKIQIKHIHIFLNIFITDLEIKSISVAHTAIIMITYKCTILYFNTRRLPYKYGTAPYDYESNSFKHDKLMVQ